jgi:acyl CoA:acetate/3-ketoacid CoA transferase alpha subunit
MNENWRQIYQEKLVSAEEAGKLVKSGDTVYSAGFSALPYDFIEALGERKDELADVDYFGFMAP